MKNTQKIRERSWNKPILKASHTRRLAWLCVIMLGILNYFGTGAWGKVLFLAHYNGSSTDADYAAGEKAAFPIQGYELARTTIKGQWAEALD